MLLSQSLLNYPIPIVAINSKGFVAAKNYIAETVFDVIHVGALAEKYTDICFSKEGLSKGMFCGKEYTYFNMFCDSSKDNSLLFLLMTTFGEEHLSFNAFDLYKERIQSLPASLDDKNNDRKYIRAVHNNLLRANYFTAFSRTVNSRLRKLEDTDTVVLSKVCASLEIAVASYLENLDIRIDVDYESGTLVSKMKETDIISIILNSLFFCVINSTDTITVNLTERNGVALLSFNFNSKSNFDKWLEPNSASGLNSSLSLAIAFKIADVYGIKYTITRSSGKKISENVLTYEIPIDIRPYISFAGEDTVTPAMKNMLLTIFFNKEL